jgi:integrase
MGKPKKRGRPRRGSPDHHLKLVGGYWIFRLVHAGKDERRATGCPKSEVATARRMRDEWLAQIAARDKAGIEPPPDPVTIGRLFELYADENAKPYDREKGGDQPGTKRDTEADEVIVKRLRKVLDFSLRADLPDSERIVTLGLSLEKMGFAGLTRRNTLRLLRCVYGWAVTRQKQTGVTANPFDRLSKPDRARLFPKAVAAKAPPFTREQLRAVEELLPSHARRPVRFAAHTGMRWESEVLRMVWGRVDFEKRVYSVDPRYAKRGKERDVPLGDVALSILSAIRPENPAPDGPVWLNASGGPLRNVRTAYGSAVREACPAPKTGHRYPDFHSLRRTCATALAQVAPMAVVAAVLGHAKETVTDGYVDVPIPTQIAELNRAAHLIDGEERAANVVEMAERMAEARATA